MEKESESCRIESMIMMFIMIWVIQTGEMTLLDLHLEVIKSHIQEDVELDVFLATLVHIFFLYIIYFNYYSLLVVY